MSLVGKRRRLCRFALAHRFSTLVNGLSLWSVGVCVVSIFKRKSRIAERNMSIPYSGTIRRSGGVVSAIGKQLKSVNLKAAKRITVKFDPFGNNVTHTRYFVIKRFVVFFQWQFQ